MAVVYFSLMYFLKTVPSRPQIITVRQFTIVANIFIPVPAVKFFHAAGTNIALRKNVVNAKICSLYLTGLLGLLGFAVSGGGNYGGEVVPLVPYFNLVVTGGAAVFHALCFRYELLALRRP